MRTGTRYFLPAWPVLIGLFLSFESAKFRLTGRGINLLDSMLGMSTVALPGVLLTACLAAVIEVSKFRRSMIAGSTRSKIRVLEVIIRPILVVSIASYFVVLIAFIYVNSPTKQSWTLVSTAVVFSTLLLLAAWIFLVAAFSLFFSAILVAPIFTLAVWVFFIWSRTIPSDWLQHLSGFYISPILDFEQRSWSTSLGPIALSLGVLLAVVIFLKFSKSRNSTTLALLAAIVVALFGLSLAYFEVKDFGPDPLVDRTDGLRCNQSKYNGHKICIWEEKFASYDLIEQAEKIVSEEYSQRGVTTPVFWSERYVDKNKGARLFTASLDEGIVSAMLSIGENFVRPKTGLTGTNCFSIARVSEVGKIVSIRANVYWFSQMIERRPEFSNETDTLKAMLGLFSIEDINEAKALEAATPQIRQEWITKNQIANETCEPGKAFVENAVSVAMLEKSR